MGGEDVSEGEDDAMEGVAAGAVARGDEASQGGGVGRGKGRCGVSCGGLR